MATPPPNVVQAARLLLLPQKQLEAALREWAKAASQGAAGPAWERLADETGRQVQAPAIASTVPDGTGENVAAQLPHISTEETEAGAQVVHRESPFPVAPKPHLSEAVRETATATVIPLDGLHGSQEQVIEGIVNTYAAGMRGPSSHKLPVVVETPDGARVIDDGHHRLTAQKLKGSRHAHVDLVKVPESVDSELTDALVVGHDGQPHAAAPEMTMSLTDPQIATLEQVQAEGKVGAYIGTFTKPASLNSARWLVKHGFLDVEHSPSGRVYQDGTRGMRADFVLTAAGRAALGAESAEVAAESSAAELKLTPAQTKFMDELKAAGSRGVRTPFTGGRNAGRVAAAWYRTAESLAKMGLIWTEREGDAERAFLGSAPVLASRSFPTPVVAWWPKDARTHADPYRCGDCGHSEDMHPKGVCEMIGLEGEACGCKRLVKISVASDPESEDAATAASKTSAVDVSEGMLGELTALEVDTWGEDPEDYARSELVHAIRTATKAGKFRVLNLTPAARYRLMHKGGALSNAIDIWSDQARAANGPSERMKLSNFLRESRALIAEYGAPPRGDVPPMAGPEFQAKRSEGAGQDAGEQASAPVSDIEETAEVHAQIKKLSKQTKSESYDPNELIAALKLIEPGWEMVRTIGLVPVREAKLNPVAGEAGFGHAWADSHNLIGADFTYYSPTSAGFSLVFGKNQPAEHNRGKPKIGVRPTRPSQKEIDELISEFQRTLLGDVIIQDDDPKELIPGKVYIATLGKPKVSEEEISEQSQDFWGKNTQLEVKWKLSNVRKAVSAFRFTSPRGEHLDIEDAKRLSPAIWNWLFKQGVPERAQKYLEATGAAEKEAKKKAMKGYSENDVIGTCGICRAIQKLRGNALVLHGYRRPGYGWIQGSCFGVGYKAWELSPEAAVAYVENLKRMIPSQKKTIADLKAAKSFTVMVPSPKSDRTWQLYTVTASGFEPKSDMTYLYEEASKQGYDRVTTGRTAKEAPEVFADAKRRSVGRAEQGLAQMIDVEKSMKADIAAWKPAPLPGNR